MEKIANSLSDQKRSGQINKKTWDIRNDLQISTLWIPVIHKRYHRYWKSRFPWYTLNISSISMILWFLQEILWHEIFFEILHGNPPNLWLKFFRGESISNVMSQRKIWESKRSGSIKIPEDLSRVYIWWFLNRKAEELFHNSVFLRKHYAEKSEKL